VFSDLFIIQVLQLDCIELHPLEELLHVSVVPHSLPKVLAQVIIKLILLLLFPLVSHYLLLVLFFLKLLMLLFLDFLRSLLRGRMHVPWLLIHEQLFVGVDTVCYL